MAQLTDFPGEVLYRGQEGYAEAAGTPFASGTPELIVRPADAAGVAAALAFARRAGVRVIVRSGGHSMAGLGTDGEGMVIDLTRLNEVTILDRSRRLVRVGGGATWGRVAAALAPHGLAISSGDTRQVGVGGLTLGGGMGWMVRRFGLAIDSLAAAEVVTADGRRLRADADQHADLFWALHGGGGNFGVVTSFEFIAQPVTSVYFGTIRFPAADVAALVAGWSKAMRDADEHLTTTLSLVPPMMGQPASVVLYCCYAADDAGADSVAQALAPLRALGSVTGDDVTLRPYAEVLEDAVVLPPGLRLEVRNTLAPGLGPDLAGAVADLFATGRAAIALRGLGGAMARVPADATAFAHRDAKALVVAGLVEPPGAPSGFLTEALSAWDKVAAYGTGSYVNFLSSASDADVAAAYPPDTYRRLAAVKRAYDPDNTFRRNYNIKP